MRRPLQGFASAPLTRRAFGIPVFELFAVSSMAVASLAPLWIVGAARATTISADTPVTIGGKPENEPDVAIVGDKAIAVYFRNQFSNASGWAYSNNGGQTWSNGGGLLLGGAGGHPSVTATLTGDFYCADIVGTSTGATVAVWKGAFQGNTFSWTSRQYAAPLITDRVRPYDAPRLVSDPEHGYLYLAYTRTHALLPSPYRYEYQIQLVRSLDGGVTWSAPMAISGLSCNGADAAVGPDGEVYVVWEDFSLKQVLGRKSSDLGASFGPPFILGSIRDNLGMQPPAWQADLERRNPAYPYVSDYFAPDFPSLAVDRSSGQTRGRLYATWTDYAFGTTDPSTGSVGDVDPNGYFGNATAVVIGQDIFGGFPFVESTGGDCDRFTFEGSAGQTIEIRAAITSSFGGYPDQEHPSTQPYSLIGGPDTTHLVLLSTTFFQEASFGDTPPMIYTLPYTGRYWLDLSCGAASWLSYHMTLRELHLDAGQVARDHRDVVLISSGDGGQNWAGKVRVNDDPPGFDQCFPQVGVDALGKVHVAWYDRHEHPDRGTTVDTYWALSDDSGGSFRPSQRLSASPGEWQFSGGGPNLGDHLALTSEGNRTMVLWTQVAPPDLVDIHGVVITTDDPTGTAISRFDAAPSGASIALTWTVADARELIGFRVERAENDGSFERITPELIQAHGLGEYAFTDADVHAGARYQYRLEVVGANGSSYEGPRELVGPGAPAQLELSLGANPFHGSLAFILSMPINGHARVDVFDAAGHLVATLLDADQPAGSHRLQWVGTNRGGGHAAAGLYLLRAAAGAETITRRIIKLE
jgi:FlgD Ig-like domain